MQIAAAAAAALTLVAGPTASDSILPDLEGVALADGSGLTLLVTRDLIDVDTTARRTIDGLPANLDNWWAFQQGRHVVVQVDCLDCPGRSEIFVFELGGNASARRIAAQRFVTPGAGETLLAMEYDSPTSCRLERIDLAGNVIDPPRPIDCKLKPQGETEAGIIARGDIDSVAFEYVVLDPATLHELVRWPAPLQLHAVVGNRALLSDDHGFYLVDLAAQEEIRLDAPDAVGHAGEGLVSPDGRYVAIEYRSPAPQVMDLWLLDLERLTWIHAPSMPVYAFIKRPLPGWTPDGRLAVVGTFGYRHLLVVWRPGDADLAIREVDTDARYVLVEELAATAARVHRADGYPVYLPDGDYVGFLTRPAPLAAWVAVHDGALVGHVALNTVTSSAVMRLAGKVVADRAVAFVARLLVDPGARRRGVGKLLLEHARREAMARGLVPMLDVVDSPTSAPAVSLYRREG